MTRLPYAAADLRFDMQFEWIITRNERRGAEHHTEIQAMMKDWNDRLILQKNMLKINGEFKRPPPSDPQTSPVLAARDANGNPGRKNFPSNRSPMETLGMDHEKLPDTGPPGTRSAYVQTVPGGAENFFRSS
jgi:hypothetical protein